MGYSLRGGFDFSFKKLTLSAGLRDEGVPVHDLIGDSHGLRRPGHNLSFESGIIYNLNKVSLYSYVPVIIARKIKQNPTDALASERPAFIGWERGDQEAILYLQEFCLSYNF